jgi:NAD(P)H-dependent flavin oxidoreductase YrpB (nitropropane dioxygenase family)
MALGAEGVQLGTRFLATVEANAPEHVRKLILAATDTSTMSAEGRVKPRINRPELAEEVLGESKRTQMGQVSALIDSIKTVDEVMHDLVDGAHQAASRIERGTAELAAARATTA